MIKLPNLRLREVIRKRAQSLVSEGYYPVVESHNAWWFFARYRHKSNGNIIIIRANFTYNKFWQWTNDKLVCDGLPII